MARGDDPAGTLRPVLDRFEAETRHQVRLTVLSWDQAWAELVKVALYGHGPDVSEIGSTWIGNLSAMSALRPFSTSELYQMGGAQSFVSANWLSGVVQDDAKTYALPWLADTRVIYYHRRLLEQAGLDADTAFDTPAHLLQTVQRLQSGDISPWAMCTTTPLRVLHEAASWVWSAGGDFASTDGRQVLFDQPAARAGLKAYFELGQYLTPELHGLDGTRADESFWLGRVAAVLSMPLVYLAERGKRPAEVQEWGVAPVLGVPFVGGSNLVLWQHSRQPQAALQLIRWLTLPQTQNAYNLSSGLLPVRLESLTSPEFVDDPNLARVAQGLQRGRSFPSIRLWGLIEDKLALALSQIWEELFSPAPPEIDVLFDKYLTPLARNLNKTLGP